MIQVAVNMETAINNMYALKNRGIKYSMNGSRTGADGTGDCSGTIYDSMRKGGATNAGWVLNTDSMHSWLVTNGFKLIAQNKEWTAQRGDVVIFGLKGASGGSAGHVVIFISNTQIIHCTWKSASANGVYVDNEATTCPYSMGWYVYRQSGGSTTPTPTPPATGKKVKVLKHATNWAPASGGKKLANFVKGGTFEVAQEKAVNYSLSNKQYLIKNNGTVLGWILSQDVEGGYGSDKVGTSVYTLPAGFTKEEATFVNGNAPITTRKNSPSLSSPTATSLFAGQSVKYLGWKSNGGYIWIYTKDGRYIPVRPVGKEAWGTFK